MTTNATDIQTLKELAQRYRVRWEVWPAYTMLNGRRLQIGFELELSGTHEPGVEHATPGCEHCRRVFLGLIEIADWILPREKRPSRYDLEPYQRAIHYSQKRGNRPDVSLNIKILHREDGLRAVDACEERCLEEMQRRLRELGASEGRWIAKKEVS